MPIFKCLSLLAVLAMCLGVSGGCAPAEEAEPAEGAASIQPKEPAQMAEPESAAEAPMEPEGVTAESLVGTTWAIADYTVTFEPDGVVRFNSGSEGSWALADDTITITVAGEETVVQIEDDRLMHNGMALQQQ